MLWNRASNSTKCGDTANSIYHFYVVLFSFSYQPGSRHLVCKIVILNKLSTTPFRKCNVAYQAQIHSLPLCLLNSNANLPTNDAGHQSKWLREFSREQVTIRKGRCCSPNSPLTMAGQKKSGAIVVES